MTFTTTTDRTLFRQTLITWLSTYTGIPANRIIWARQQTTQPAKPYATIDFPSGLGSIKFGFDETRAEFNAISELIERTTAGPRQIIAQVQVYTDPATAPNLPEARELLEDALLALDSQAVRDLFRAAKIGFFSHSAALPLDDQFAELWHRREQSDITLMYSGETFDDGGAGSGDWIETVEVPTEANTNATYGD